MAKYTVTYKDGKFYVNGKRVTQIFGSGGYRFIGRTTNRLILKADDDINYWLCGFERALRTQTKAEIRFHKKIKAGDKKYFPKIIASGKYYNSDCDANMYWLLQEKLPIRMQVVTEKVNKAFCRIKKRYKIGDLYAEITGHKCNGKSNWCIVEDRPMFYDCGLTGRNW